MYVQFASFIQEGNVFRSTLTSSKRPHFLKHMKTHGEKVGYLLANRQYASKIYYSPSTNDP